MQGIRKSFPGVVALDGVDFDVRRGEVHVLLGENGAGKSTLLKILSGAYTKDEGRIWIGGVEVDVDGPRRGRELGLGVIYQELTLVPELSVAENIMLGREPRRPRWTGVIDAGRMHASARAALELVGAPFDERRTVSSLSLAEQQLVEIARALSLDARILVMDEPTSALSERETRALFDVIRRLTSDGVSIIYISHRLDEIFEIGDRVTVLRDGRHIATRDIRSADRRELVRLMAARDVDEKAHRSAAHAGDELLRVQGLERKGVLHDISFSLRRGEIVCFAGLMGSGRSEVLRAVFGCDPVDHVEVYVRGAPCRIRTPRDAVRARIGFVPEDRKRQGLVLNRTVRENIVLPVLRRLSRFGVVDAGRERGMAERFVRELRIRTPSTEQSALNLSGGNQQKIVLAKWLANEVDILFLDEPTRGIDVGAKQEVYQLIDALTARGVGVLMVSSELPEVLSLADRVLVMREGRVCGEFTAAEATAESLMACAVGA